MKSKKIRRPRDLAIGDRLVAHLWPVQYPRRPECAVFIGAVYKHLTPRETRRLAAWLLKAADYVEQETGVVR